MDDHQKANRHDATPEIGGAANRQGRGDFSRVENRTASQPLAVFSGNPMETPSTANTSKRMNRAVLSAERNQVMRSYFHEETEQGGILRGTCAALREAGKQLRLMGAPEHADMCRMQAETLQDTCNKVEADEAPELRRMLATMIDNLLEVHQGEIESKHGLDADHDGEAPEVCSYCRDIAKARELIGEEEPQPHKECQCENSHCDHERGCTRKPVRQIATTSGAFWMCQECAKRMPKQYLK